MTNLRQLEETIAVFGGDAARWPAGRAEVLRSVLRSADGAAMLREAGALDTVLSAASPAVVAGSDILVTRIMVATAGGDGNTGAAQRPSVSSAGRIRPASGAGVRKHKWVAGGLMAASLLIGVIAGLNGFGAAVAPDGKVFVQGGQAERLGSADDALLADLTLGSNAEHVLEDDV